MATKPVKKPRKPRVKRQPTVQPIQIDLLRQGDLEVGFRPNLRPIQQASLLGNLLTNVSNQEKLSALSASLKQYEKELEQSKKSPTIVTTAEEVKPVALASSQVGRLRDIKFVETKTKELEGGKQFKQDFNKQFGLGATLEEDLDLSSPMASIRFGQPLLANPPSTKPFSGSSRPTPLATIQRRPTPPLQSSSTLITREGVMAEVRRENVDLRSAQRIAGDEEMYD
jgi:hypothetical protein